MTTARVIPFFPHRVGRKAAVFGREPESPFRRFMDRRELTPREIGHRQAMLAHLYKQRADPKVGPMQPATANGGAGYR